MKYFTVFMFSLSIMGLGTTSHCHAEEGLDAASQNGLDNTIQLLNDPTLREKAAKENQSAGAAHSEVKKLGGADTQNSIYELSGDIFKKLVQQTGGDPVKLQELMLKAQKDPESFAKNLGADDLNKLRGIASKVEKKAAPTP